MEVLTSAVGWRPLHSVLGFLGSFCPFKSLPHVPLFVFFFISIYPMWVSTRRWWLKYYQSLFCVLVSSFFFQDQKFLPKNSAGDVSWCSLITFKLLSKQHNKSALPSNTLSNSLAVLEWGTWPFYKLLRCLLSPLNTLLSNFSSLLVAARKQRTDTISLCFQIKTSEK